MKVRRTTQAKWVRSCRMTPRIEMGSFVQKRNTVDGASLGYGSHDPLSSLRSWIASDTSDAS
jgi:hypothetical protein